MFDPAQVNIFLLVLAVLTAVLLGYLGYWVYQLTLLVGAPAVLVLLALVANTML